jgi:hypothetical protein
MSETSISSTSGSSYSPLSARRPSLFHGFMISDVAQLTDGDECRVPFWWVELDPAE